MPPNRGQMGPGGPGGPPGPGPMNQPGMPPGPMNQPGMHPGGPMQNQMGGMGGGPPNMNMQNPMGPMNHCRPGSDPMQCGPNGPHGMNMNGMQMNGFPPGRIIHLKSKYIQITLLCLAKVK